MQKRMISVILCLTLLIGMLPAAVAVVPGMKGGTSTNVGNSEGLQDLTIEDGIAAVRFAVSEDAELVVAVYEEESGRQIASAKTTVRPSDSTAILPLIPHCRRISMRRLFYFRPMIILRFVRACVLR